MMIMEYIENIDTKNKKVILRLDLNVTIKNGEIMDDTKIVKSVPTIKYLLNNGCNILIMSHLGKVKSLEDKMQNSLKPVKDVLEKLLEQEVVFVPNTREPELKSILDSNRLVLLENTRFEDYPGKLESGCDEELSKYWASLGEVFINDAFGTTHRRHASNYGISKYLPSAYGFLIKQELDGLDPIVNNINRPFAVIMGGAKVDDKIALIKTLVKECDYLLVGGGIANTFLKAEGKEIGNSLYSAD
jgi:phosphoglycerate kinase